MKILETLNSKGVEVVDPVFLLTKEQWSAFAGEERIFKDKYILVYDIDLDNDDIRKEVERLNKLYGYKIVAVCALKNAHTHKRT